MNPLENLSEYSGKWQGTNRLQDPHTNQPEDSSSSMTLSPILAGRFIRIDYTWGYQGKPQEGSMLIGYDQNAKEVTIHWIDTWHNGNNVMASRGTADANGEISTFGTFPAPPDPDWGWTIKISPSKNEAIHVVMHCIPPEGKGDAVFACEANYKRI
jgi:hypothetical protein